MINQLEQTKLGTKLTFGSKRCLARLARLVTMSVAFSIPELAVNCPRLGFDCLAIVQAVVGSGHVPIAEASSRSGRRGPQSPLFPRGAPARKGSLAMKTENQPQLRMNCQRPGVIVMPIRLHLLSVISPAAERWMSPSCTNLCSRCSPREQCNRQRQTMSPPHPLT
jgi:hypothetical protein